MNVPFSDQEWEVMDELYFVIPYAELKENISFSENELRVTLKTLLQRKLIDQFTYDRTRNDYLRMADRELKNLHQYAYLANKTGMLAHNRMN